MSTSQPSTQEPVLATDAEELQFEQPLEDDDETVEVPSNRRQIYTDQGDPEIESLHGKYKRGRLNIQPEFQTKWRWDVKRASRLIESALLEIPLPTIYLSEDSNGTETVIDGQQRLTSFFSFIDGKLPNGKDFKLTGLKVFEELDGDMFKDLNEQLQDKIRYYTVRTITFKKESQKDLKFEIFERLNTGSVSLNDQELRNCMFRGPFNNLLKDLATQSDFTYLLGLSKPDNRMKDIELVLRFAAFHHNTYLNYKPPMKRFLNDEAERYQFISESDSAALKKAFKDACAIIRSLLDRHAFKRFYKGGPKDPNGRWEPKKFNASLYDILMYSFAREDKNKVYQNLDAIRESLINLMTNDDEFINSIELSTSSVQAVTKRFDKWRLALQEIIGIGQKEPRCFSMSLKQELFDANATCTICGQRIQNVDDAAVDHVKQYWTGGPTIPENARLTHRYCNWARSRSE
jgi:hypothetical protein